MEKIKFNYKKHREYSQILNTWQNKFNHIFLIWCDFPYFKLMSGFNGSWSNFKKMLKYLAKKPTLKTTVIITNDKKKETVRANI